MKPVFVHPDDYMALLSTDEKQELFEELPQGILNSFEDFRFIESPTEPVIHRASRGPMRSRNARRRW